MTVAELIIAAYADIGATDIESGPTAAQLQQGFTALNSMIGSWSREQMTLYNLVDESFTLTPGQSEYTVGSGGNFDTAWAYLVENAYVRDANGIDYPLQIISQNQYDNVALKTVSTRPEYLLYTPRGYPTGTVTIYQVPDKAYTLFWTAQKLLVSYSSTDDSLGVPPEYQEPMEFNLAIRLAMKSGVSVGPELATLARESRAIIPVTIEPASFDGAFDRGRRYNIFSDQI